MTPSHHPTAVATRLLTALIVALAALTVTPAAQAPRAEVIDRIVAKINGDIITLHDLRRAAGPYVLSLNRDPDELNNPEFARTIYGDVLDDMINTRLLLQQARELQLEISDDDVTRWIGSIASRQQLKVEQFRDALKSKGVSWQDYRRFVHDNLLKFRVIQIKLGSRIKITDDELSKAYADRFGQEPKRVKTVRLSQILIRTPEDDPDLAKRGEQLVKDTYQRLQSGEDFGDVAREVSMGSTAENGGILPDPFQPGALPPAFEEAVFATKASEFTAPIYGRSGYSIFLVRQIEFQLDDKVQQQLDQLRNVLYEAELNKSLTSWIDTLRKRAYIETMFDKKP